MVGNPDEVTVRIPRLLNGPEKKQRMGEELLSGTGVCARLLYLGHHASQLEKVSLVRLRNEIEVVNG
jgi:hypothetical protein